MVGKKQITIHSYDSCWPLKFEDEANRIKDLLGEKCLAVHHIGSTSVPGLAAKNNLDILCIVDQLSSSQLLSSIGYLPKGELNIPLRLYYSKNTPQSKVNLHVVEKDHAFTSLNLCFRDHLRSHPVDRDAYEQLKWKLVKNPENFERVNGGFPRYTLEKNAFIMSILRKAGFQGLLLNHCTHYTEWQAYYRLHAATQCRLSPASECPTQYPMVFCKGSDIVAAIHIDFLNSSEAVMRFISFEQSTFDESLNVSLWSILKRWLQYHHKSLLP